MSPVLNVANEEEPLIKQGSASKRPTFVAFAALLAMLALLALCVTAFIASNGSVKLSENKHKTTNVSVKQHNERKKPATALSVLSQVQNVIAINQKERHHMTIIIEKVNSWHFKSVIFNSSPFQFVKTALIAEMERISPLFNALYRV